MLENALFYPVFLCQVILLSWYFPRKLSGRMRHVFTHYPPADYPKLYPMPAVKYEMAQRDFRLANWALFGLGIVILTAVAYWDFSNPGYVSLAVPAAYGMAQTLPILALEFSAFRQLKLMRKLNVDTTRSADLTPRRLFDFVSPALFWLAVFCLCLALFTSAWAHGFVFAWGHDTVEGALVLLGTNLFFAVMVLWNLYGKKKNPHQAEADRNKQIRTVVHSAVFTSIAVSAFFGVMSLNDVFDMDAYKAVIMSIYFQVILSATLGYICRTVPIDSIDFDVYKNGPVAL